MTDSPDLDEKHARNRKERIRFIRQWAEYVRTHPDDVWGAQVNALVDSQIESARNVEDERPDMDRLREESALLNPGESDETDD